MTESSLAIYRRVYIGKKRSVAEERLIRHARTTFIHPYRDLCENLILKFRHPELVEGSAAGR
jgi:hypothetical protein